MPRDFTKRQKAEIRRLNDLAWERELSAALENLRREFDALKSGQISAFEMSDKVHQFHQHTARELYKCYGDGRNPFAVPGAIGRGVVQRAEVSPEVLELLEPTIKALFD